MEESESYRRALDEVFRRIGRNVFVFEQIELLLKTLINNGRFVGTASQLKKLVAERGAKPDKRTMGQLIDPLIDYHLTPADSGSSEPEGTREIAISFLVTFNHTDEERAVFRTELEMIVAERNDLIHTLLLRYRFDTLEGCQKASEDLEKQISRIVPMRDNLRIMVNVMEDIKPQVARALEQIKAQRTTEGESVRSSGLDGGS